MPRRPKQKISQLTPLDVRIDSLTHDGRGIGTLEGKKQFVFAALPGELATFKLKSIHSRYNEGEAISIANPSPDRTTPLCPHFGVCGGCSFQHIRHDRQVAIKQDAVLSQLKQVGKTIPEKILPALTGDLWGYRQRARLGVRYVLKKEKIMVGFRERDGRYLADLSICDILDPRVGKNIEGLKQLIRSLSCFEHIAQIELAADKTRVALIIRHLMPLSELDKTLLIAFAKQHAYDIFLQPNAPLPITKLWPEDGVFQLSYALPQFNLRYQFELSDFTQINASVNQAMVAQAIELLNLQNTDRVLDLFCGLGNFTLPLATKAGSVIGIEGSETMVARAQDNAALNQINNAEFYACDLFKPLPQTPWATQAYDKILLDPPRSGAEAVVANIERFQAKLILYVSCDPATLARDTAVLISKGYILESFLIADMFSHTAHVESMALFRKK